MRSETALQAVGLWEHRNKKPLEMSGGQRQRVALARAFAKRPSVILADEPTASLDQNTGRQILEIMRELNEKTGVTLIVCS
ncbi:ATP-binding cassette domain-containing protein, partial [Acinetobacter baumannii]